MGHVQFYNASSIFEFMMTPSISKTVAPKFAKSVSRDLIITEHALKPKFIICPLPESSSLGFPILVEDTTQLFTSETCVPSCCSPPLYHQVLQSLPS